MVSGALLQRSRDVEGDRLSDDPCLVAEGALFFCHKTDTDHFFVRDLAEIVNASLKGRHEDRTLTDKKSACSFVLWEFVHTEWSKVTGFR